MGVTKFSFKVACPPDRITAKAFSLATETFTRILSKANADSWLITEARIASVDLTARPSVADAAASESVHVMERIATLSSPAGPDQGTVGEFKQIIDNFSVLTNETGADLVMVVNDRESVFTSDILDGCQRLLKKASRRSFGHVTGKVDRLILQQSHRSMGLVDKNSGLRIKVSFTSKLDSSVSKLNLGAEIDVKGFIRRNSDGSLSMEAEDIIRIVDRHRPLVTADDLEGVLRIQLSDNMDSAAIVASMRKDRSDELTVGGTQ